MTTQEKRREVITVNSAAAVEGRDGPQWQLEIKLPWSKFPSKAWIPRSPNTPAPTPGEYEAVLVRGAKQDGKDGTKDFHYQWRVESLGVPPQDKPYGPEDTIPFKPGDTKITSVAPPARPDPTRISIERQTALKAAVEFTLAASPQKPEWENVLQAAEGFYAWLSGQSPANAPRMPQEQPAATAPLTLLQAQKTAPVPTSGEDAPSPFPTEPQTAGMFVSMAKARGWTPSKIQAWLDGHYPVSTWLTLNPGRTLHDAWMLCLTASGEKA